VPALDILAALLVVGLAASGLWLGLNLFRRDIRIENGPALHMRDLLELKRSIASEVAAPRILFFGLSNVMMGIRAEQIGAALGARAVNCGVLANLTAGIAFEAIERIANRGDLVVLSLPYWFFQKETTLLHQKPYLKELVFSYPTWGFFHLPLAYQIEFLARQRPRYVFGAISRKLLRALGFGN